MTTYTLPFISAGHPVSTLSSTVLNNGDQEIITSGGTAYNTTINSGGVETVSSGGKAYYTTVNSGGSEQVASGGFTYRTTLNHGGSEQIASGGSVWGTLLKGAGEVVNNGGYAENTTVSSGGSETVNSGGVVSNTYISSGGTESVNSGGVDKQSFVLSGGVEIVSNGGTAIDTGNIGGSVQINKGGTEVVSPNGYVTNITVNSGGTEQILSGGSPHNTVLNNGGSEQILSGGSAYNTQLYSGGSEQFSNGGTAFYTSVNAGASEQITSGGVASGTSIASGGNQTVLHGGASDYTSINAGGVEQVASGGVAYFTTINVGGSEQIASGGIASATNITSGGSEVIANGGASYYATVNSGGIETVGNGGTAYYPFNSGGTENVLSGGELIINNGLNGISLSVGAKLDLAGVIATQASVTTTDHLLLANQGNSVKVLGLVGDNSNFAFNCTPDGAGGTLVTVALMPPALSTAAYNAATGQLSLTGAHLIGPANAYNVTDFTLKGDGNSSYTLTGGSVVIGTPTSTGVNIQLSAADELAINGLLNKNGVLANDGSSHYNLSAGSGWDTGAGPISTQTVTVSHVTAPSLNSVTYNAATGVFTVTGTNLDNHGSTNGIALANFTLSGGKGSYSFSPTADSVSNLTATGFNITLSTADKTSVNSFVDHNGSAPLSGKAYNLAATVNWDSDSGARITNEAVNVSGVLSPTLHVAAQSLVAFTTGDTGGNAVTFNNGGLPTDGYCLVNGPAVEITLIGLTAHPTMFGLGDVTQLV